MADCSYKAAVDKKRRNMSRVTGKKLTSMFLCITFTKEPKKNSKRGIFFAGKHKPIKRAMEPNIFLCMRLFSLFAVTKRSWMGRLVKKLRMKHAECFYYAIVLAEYHDEEQI
jgi:hypothetical protein